MTAYIHASDVATMSLGQCLSIPRVKMDGTINLKIMGINIVLEH